MKSSCCIIIPCFDEGSRLKSAEFIKFLQDFERIRIVFVNDGSRDNTLAVLEYMRLGYEDRIQILDKIKNSGKAEAVRAGMLSVIAQCDADYIGFWDADLAVPLEVIPQFIDLLDARSRLEMVFGSRVRLLGRDVQRRTSRHYLGRIFASLASITLRLPIYDTQCGAKLFRITPELSQILQETFLSSWIFDVEILARYIAFHQGNVAHLHDLIYEFPLLSCHDVAGSKVHPSDSLRAALDLFRIHRRYLSRGTSRSHRPVGVLAAPSARTLGN
jgi:dolichyl-phosphate beta-glucosyltransferase